MAKNKKSSISKSMRKARREVMKGIDLRSKVADTKRPSPQKLRKQWKQSKKEID